MKQRKQRTVFDKMLTNPQPVRTAIRSVIRNAGIGSFAFRHRIGALRRQNYAHLVYEAAQLAKKLGHKKVAVAEFGVAGGDGLLAMECHAADVSRQLGIEIEVYGFDTASGLPAPTDYRDLPYHWRSGFFKMDFSALESRLTRAKLVIGDIRDTISSFVTEYRPAPIGAVSFDLDFYSSTMAALTLLDSPYEFLLPRMPIYFDDVIGSDAELYNDYVGVRLAVHEFNAARPKRKLSPLYYLVARDPLTPWHHKMWSFHAFEHPSYAQFIAADDQQLPL